MKTHTTRNAVTAAIAALVLAGCSASMTRPDGADDARARLSGLQADPQLASRAPVAINEAAVAVRAAEKPQSDEALGRHLVAVANRRVDIAAAQAQTRLLEDQRKTLAEERERARLDSRTREADFARDDANAARRDADDAQRLTADLKRQIEELNARETDRGLVVTLGDLLFATGRSDLNASAAANLARIATFLNTYVDRTVQIEGHTDNVGSAYDNMTLSQRRAESVKNSLVRAGVSGARLQTSGMGYASPVASNATAAGRQQNRRVELIISNATTASR